MFFYYCYCFFLLFQLHIWYMICQYAIYQIFGYVWFVRQIIRSLWYICSHSGEIFEKVEPSQCGQAERSHQVNYKNIKDQFCCIFISYVSIPLKIYHSQSLSNLSHQVDYKNIENYHSKSLSYFGFSGKTIGSILFLSTSRWFS